MPPCEQQYLEGWGFSCLYILQASILFQVFAVAYQIGLEPSRTVAPECLEAVTVIGGSVELERHMAKVDAVDSHYTWC